MEGKTAWTAKELSPEERKARLAEMVTRGVITAEFAAIIQSTEVPPQVKARARELGRRLASCREPAARVCES